MGLGLVACLGCGSNAPPPGAQNSPEPAAGGVIFRYHDADAARVCVVGDFNNWTLHADPLVDKNGDGQWTLFFPLKPGTYEYKFVVDGTRWIADPKNPASVSDGFEGFNSVAKVQAPAPQ
jgi:1,4-alpha-glucan branching enzyme